MKFIIKGKIGDESMLLANHSIGVFTGGGGMNGFI